MASKPAVADNAAEFAWQHDDVFGRIASRYDVLCDVFSFGIHRFWKRAVARQIASEEWRVLLDGALAVEFRDHGFDEVAFERHSLGIVAIHAARKPYEPFGQFAPSK